MEQQYVVVVPVKPPARGKSRLGSLPDEQRRDLAGAFALDTVTACLAARRVAQVLVATDDASFATRLSALGCTAIPDGDDRGLNPALRQAAAEAQRRWPDLTAAALCADLPALLPGDLDAALAEITALPGSAAAYVADAAGSGTTLYSAPYADFDPRFGVGSSAAHLAAGARPVGLAARTLRRDVDDLTDLESAATLGLGAHTAAALAGIDLG